MKLYSMDIVRYWSHVDRSGGPDACWPWIRENYSCLDTYCQFWLDGKFVQSTHVAMVLDGRFVREDYKACHTCDHPGCNNPKHLYEGTSQQNTNDITDRNRWNPSKGESHCRSILTDLQRIEIKKLLETGGFTLRELGRKYRVSHTSIRRLDDERRRESA